MINDLRYDWGYALIEEYRTYWDAFQDPDDCYTTLLQMDPIFSDHFKNRKQQAKGFNGKCDFILSDQNTFWFVTYSATLKALSIIHKIRQEELEIVCKKHRWNHERQIINLKDNNIGIDPLDP